jgi:hypothetical protein
VRAVTVVIAVTVAVAVSCLKEVVAMTPNHVPTAASAEAGLYRGRGGVSTGSHVATRGVAGAAVPLPKGGRAPWGQACVRGPGTQPRIVQCGRLYNGVAVQVGTAEGARLRLLLSQGAVALVLLKTVEAGVEEAALVPLTVPALSRLS